MVVPCACIITYIGYNIKRPKHPLRRKKQLTGKPTEANQREERTIARGWGGEPPVGTPALHPGAAIDIEDFGNAWRDYFIGRLRGVFGIYDLRLMNYDLEAVAFGEG